jgi:hypothetical protein
VFFVCLFVILVDTCVFCSFVHGSILYAKNEGTKNTRIVHPTKKNTNLSQSGEVPKVGNGRSFGKKCFHGKVEVRNGEVAMDRHFLLFHVLVSVHVP